MKKRVEAALLFFLLAAALCWGEGYTTTPTYLSIGEPRVEIRDLTLSPTSVYPGGSIDFSVTMRNYGTVSTTATLAIQIYDASNRVVGTIPFDPVQLFPGQIVTVQKTWGVGSLPIGNYRAVAQASYDSNFSNSFERSFSIVRIPSPPSLPPSQTMGQLPVILPSEITPVEGKAVFLKTTVLRELLAGEGAVESIALKNIGEAILNITFSFEGIPKEWASLPSDRTLLLPNEIQIMNLGFSIPKDVLSGDYLVKLNADGNANSTDFLALRVKRYPDDYDKPIALKTIRVDERERKTSVSIEVKNPSQNTMELVQVEERIPAVVSENQIEFLDRRGRVVESEGGKLIVWELSDVKPKESLTISYNIKNFITDYSTYMNWRVYQVLVTQKYSTADLIKVLDITSSGINDSIGEVTASVLYVGNEPLQVTMVLEAPAGFSVEPAAVTKTLLPKGVAYVSFKLTAPKTAQETHMVRLVIMGEEFATFTTAPIIIKREAPPFSLLSILSLQQIVLLSAFVAAAVAVSVVSYRRIMKHRHKPQFSEERLNYLKNIKGMVVSRKSR
ncbi:MAG: hypothetical protein QXF56_05430 [Candidatus Micrarchaeia archaeon]